jgi:hypothetical protein
MDLKLLAQTLAPIILKEIQEQKKSRANPADKNYHEQYTTEGRENQ